MDRAGIREVAKAAGVSISTVSRAFTRPELVSERTRRKVLETADKLDFNISRSATSLKSGQSYRVAMLMNEEITSWFNTEVFAGIESVMHNAGYDVSQVGRLRTRMRLCAPSSYCAAPIPCTALAAESRVSLPFRSPSMPTG